MAFKGLFDDITGSLTSITSAIAPIASAYFGYQAVRTASAAQQNRLSQPAGVTSIFGTTAPTGTPLPPLQSLEEPGFLGMSTNNLLLLGGGALLVGSLIMLKKK